MFCNFLVLHILSLAKQSIMYCEIENSIELFNQIMDCKSTCALVHAYAYMQYKIPLCVVYVPVAVV